MTKDRLCCMTRDGLCCMTRPELCHDQGSAEQPMPSACSRPSRQRGLTCANSGTHFLASCSSTMHSLPREIHAWACSAAGMSPPAALPAASLGTCATGRQKQSRLSSIQAHQQQLRQSLQRSNDRPEAIQRSRCCYQCEPCSPGWALPGWAPLRCRAAAAPTSAPAPAA